MSQLGVLCGLQYVSERCALSRPFDFYGDSLYDARMSLFDSSNAVNVNDYPIQPPADEGSWRAVPVEAFYHATQLVLQKLPNRLVIAFLEAVFPSHRDRQSLGS